MSAAQTDAPHSHIPYGQEGSGYYSDNTLGCYNVIQMSTALVLDCIKSIEVRPNQVFNIVDYGCADGGTSMPLLYTCIEELRKTHDSELAIHVTYEDQPVNDFKALFLRLQGLIPGPKSYFLEFPNVYVTACGTSFFRECLPPSSVQLGFSATAMHWLSKKPCDITGALHHTMITDLEEKEKFRKQAAGDWETILLYRAKELVPGGRMVLVQFAVDSEGQFLGNTKNIKESMHHWMRDLWQGMVDDGSITQDEFQRTTFLNYYRCVEEFKKPFESETSPVPKAGLSLVSIETKLVPCPYHKNWVLGEGGDPTTHAQWYVPTTRTWSNSTFMSALSDRRSPEEKSKIVDTFFRRYEREVAKNPANHGMDYVHAYIVIEKKKPS